VHEKVPLLQNTFARAEKVKQAKRCKKYNLRQKFL
jgi:hypothetical protein